MHRSEASPFVALHWVEILQRVAYWLLSPYRDAQPNASPSFASAVDRRGLSWAWTTSSASSFFFPRLPQPHPREDRFAPHPRSYIHAFRVHIMQGSMAPGRRRHRLSPPLPLCPRAQVAGDYCNGGHIFDSRSRTTAGHRPVFVPSSSSIDMASRPRLPRVWWMRAYF